MSDSRIASFEKEVEKVLHHLHSEYAKLQTGRANAALIEHATVDAYGQRQELRSVAGISVPDARTIVVQPWDMAIIGDIEKALTELDLGSSPVNDGTVVRINLPPMTEDRRKDMVKVVHQMAEECRISIRQQRQSVHDAIKNDEKDEDVRYTLLEELDKAVKTANDQVEETMKKKEEEVMTV
jgi:ribosome recycling factor